MQKIIDKMQLIQTLQQKIAQCYQQYQFTDQQKIYAKFDRTLFSEDNQTFAFYRAELNQTLAQLERLQHHEQSQCLFYSEKLLAQLQALLDVVVLPKSIKKTLPKRTALSPQEKRKHEIHRLPPRERLEKYYKALQALNEKITQQQDQYYQASSEVEKQRLQQYLTHTQQRKARCIEAIELLEEYLTLQENK